MGAQKRLWKKVRVLTQLLILSGSVNILFFVFFLYSWVTAPSIHVPLEKAPAGKSHRAVPLADFRGKREVIEEFFSLKKEELIAYLKSTKLVEDGFTQRDLALACLQAFHDFDIPKALGTKAQDARFLLLSQENGIQEGLDVYPDLEDDDFEEVLDFIRTERWPLTSYGLFQRLHNNGYAKDLSLAQAFCVTSEYASVETLLARSDVPITKREILDLLLEGDWKTLESFVEKQRSYQDLSVPMRQNFLLDYIVQHDSKTAAMLILRTDPLLIAHKLDDERLLLILELLDPQSSEAKWLFKELSKSARGREVMEFLAHVFGEKIDKLVESPAFKPITHVVIEGDSLWKIARKYKVEIDAIKKVNGIESDFIQPGIIIEIPQKAE